MNTNVIAFPNLDLGPWEINKFLIQIGNFKVAWYGIIITIGIILAVLYTIKRGKQEGFTTDDVLDYAIWVVLVGILGARLYYVAMTWGRYESFLDIFAIWNGGLAIYGGLIGGALMIMYISYKKQKSVLKFFDMVTPGVMIAQALGRWGNFFNAEAYGSILKFEFLGKTFETSRFAGQAIPWIMTIENVNGSALYYAHPTFLYESLWNVLGFILLNLRYRNKKFDGQILFSYIVWYGFGRMFIEGYRTDSLYLGNVRISQLLALGCVIFGIMFYHLLRKKAKPVLKAEQDAQEYESLFSDKPAKKKKSSSSASKAAAAAPEMTEEKPVTEAAEATEEKTEDEPSAEDQ
ncbi:MAG: prolipoprotein diacylglyceryl transferase [Clostridia bacterium]|nr:prolipoprotein diacylglyceryl transferase [Clostridia bacterium]